MARNHLPPIDVVFSLDALRRAWRQVRRKGDSPGSDGVTPQAFEATLEQQIAALRRDVISEVYRPQPVLRFLKRKANGKHRPLVIWSLRDRVAQRVVVDTLTPVTEAMFFRCSYGFRPGLSTSDAVHAIVRARDAGFRWVLDADITECFDSIPVELLLGQVQRLMLTPPLFRLIALWLATPVAGRPNTRVGVSQGAVTSPLLANIYLHRLDQMMLSALPQSCLVRYADDFVVLSRTEADARWSMEVAGRALANLRLKLNQEKTRVIHFRHGFEFLGTSFHANKVEPRSVKAALVQEEDRCL